MLSVMDTYEPGAPAPVPNTTSRGMLIVRLVLVVLVLAIVAGGAYYGWQRFAYEQERGVLREEFSKTVTPVIAYVLPEGSGSRWYELHNYIDTIEHPVFKDGSITDVARSKHAYIIGKTSAGYGVYRETGEGYEPLYISEFPLSSLAVSPDGEQVAFAQEGGVSQVGVIISGQQVSWLGAGFSPAFVGEASLAFLSGPAIRVHVREGAGWDAGTVVYTAEGVFSSQNVLVSSGTRLAISMGGGSATVIDTANLGASSVSLSVHDLPIDGSAGASFVGLAPLSLGAQGAIAVAVEGQAQENPIVIPFPDTVPATIRVIE